MSHAPVILFVEGHLADREYYSQHFRITFPSFEIVEAATGKSGLAFCERKLAECIVVLEIDLPDMSGFEVLLRLIPHAQQPEIAVIVLTRLSNLQLLEAAVENGAQAAMVKGITSAEILEKAILKALSTLQVNLTSHPEPEPPVLLMCDRCRLVHGEEGGWMTKQTYREATGIDPVTCLLTHTDCPFCHDFLLCHPQAA
jgi:CheY-like chemotaxis protein